MVKGNLKPERLPLTEVAVRQHVLRAFSLYQDWIILESMSLNPLEYGWKKTANDFFQPIGTLNAIAVQQLLKITFCNCKYRFKTNPMYMSMSRIRLY